jgi:hypothetical protein
MLPLPSWLINPDLNHGLSLHQQEEVRRGGCTEQWTGRDGKAGQETHIASREVGGARPVKSQTNRKQKKHQTVDSWIADSRNSQKILMGTRIASHIRFHKYV